MRTAAKEAWPTGSPLVLGPPGRDRAAQGPLRIRRRPLAIPLSRFSWLFRSRARLGSVVRARCGAVIQLPKYRHSAERRPL